MSVYIIFIIYRNCFGKIGSTTAYAKVAYNKYCAYYKNKNK